MLLRLKEAIAEKERVDVPFGGCDGAGRFFGERFGKLTRRRLQLFWLGDTIQQAQRKQFLGLVVATFENRFTRTPGTHPRRQ